MWSSRMDQKWKYLRVFVLLLAITMNKNPNGAATDIEKLTKLVNEIQENYKMEKSQLESTISSLQAELASNKKVIEEEISKLQVGKLNDTVFGMKSSTDERMEQIETNLDEKFGNLEEVLEEKIGKLENASFPLLSPFDCPTLKSNSKFQLVENVCYYFEFESSYLGRLSGKLPYRDAQQNCQIVFGPHGHLFEPDTPEKSRQIHKLASSMI